MKHKKSKKYINSKDSKQELKKFINFAGSVKKAAELLGTSTQIVYGWRIDRTLIKEEYAEAMEIISNSFCSKQKLMIRDNAQKKKKFASFEEMVNKMHIEKRCELSELSIDDIYNECLNINITKSIKDVSMLDSEEKKKLLAQKLSAVFGGTIYYWFSELRIYKK